MGDFLEKNQLRGRDFLESNEDDDIFNEYFSDSSGSDTDAVDNSGDNQKKGREFLESDKNELRLEEYFAPEAVDEKAEGSEAGDEKAEGPEAAHENAEGSEASNEVGGSSSEAEKKGRDFLGEVEDLEDTHEKAEGSEAGDEKVEGPEAAHDKAEGSEASNEVGGSSSEAEKKGRDFLGEVEDSYPKIIYLSDKKSFDVPNVELSQGNYIAAGTTAAVSVAGAASLYSSLISQLGNAIGNAPLAKTIVNSNLGTFLSMDKKGMQGANGGIRKVAEVKADNIMKFYSPFISKVILAEKSVNLATDFGKTLHEPNQDNMIKFAVDLGDVAGTYYGFTPFAALPITANAAYLAYQGEYTQAAGQFIMASSYVLPYIMAPANPFSLVILGGIGVYTAYNFYTSLSGYMSDKDGLNSMIAYKDFYHSLSSKREQEYDIAISKIQKENIERYLLEQGEFGERLNEHLYRLFQTKEDEVAPKHAIIELEDKSYNHCIEFKAAMDVDNNTHYNCYSDELKLIDRVIIGENEDVINVISVNNIYHG